MKLLREPLIHFLGLGAGLFLLYAAVGWSATPTEDEIRITPNLVKHLAEVW